MSFLSNISFAIPSALFALFILPAVWFLLKVFPPSPSKIIFPATRFLLNIKEILLDLRNNRIQFLLILFEIQFSLNLFLL